MAVDNVVAGRRGSTRLLRILLIVGVLLLSAWGVAAQPLPLPFVTILTPQQDARVKQGNPLRVQVQVRFLRSDPLACQEWFLDGRRLVPADWLGGQSPDLSEGPC